VTLAEQRELVFFGAKDLGKQAEKLGMKWHHLPVPDMGIPDGTFEALWSVAAPDLHKILRAGGRLAVHCRAGLGRTGMITARLLIEMGATPDAAVKAVRAAKTGAIETDEQEAYVRACQRVAGA
jgi:protein-tyrosine phosphatase